MPYTPPLFQVLGIVSLGSFFIAIPEAFFSSLTVSSWAEALKIDNKVQQYIRKDAAATISSDGLIGNKIVMIVGGSTRVEAVEDGDRLAVRPVGGGKK